MPREFGRVLAAVRVRAPRVQCITNSVAQSISANCLHAIGAGASMALHRDEVVAMTRSADAALINLGTPDEARMAAIAALVSDGMLASKPVVVDPVYVQHSPLRLRLALDILQASAAIVKGNREEVVALRSRIDPDIRAAIVWAETGATDRLMQAARVQELTGGHPWMAAVTGLGCALGAVMAACAAVEPSRFAATHTALALFAAAGSSAGLVSRGPGSFAVTFIDELHRLSLEASE